ncbi:hypothetical protein F5148DRAFT_391173 [Russula earlei]|uniref:Uncharacterized protein n=1 Tax=Russula earlei TaxID=71964 RepID=A0ACC0UIA1_9AGAM|nr:hypothetical protein F5148DRAFT_391173 [Russula earlei]
MRTSSVVVTLCLAVGAVAPSFALPRGPGPNQLQPLDSVLAEVSRHNELQNRLMEQLDAHQHQPKLVGTLLKQLGELEQPMGTLKEQLTHHQQQHPELGKMVEHLDQQRKSRETLRVHLQHNQVQWQTLNTRPHNGQEWISPVP